MWKLFLVGRNSSTNCLIQFKWRPKCFNSEGRRMTPDFHRFILPHGLTARPTSRTSRCVALYAFQSSQFLWNFNWLHEENVARCCLWSNVTKLKVKDIFRSSERANLFTSLSTKNYTCKYCLFVDESATVTEWISVECNLTCLQITAL